MSTIVESTNVISSLEEAPDKLRAEIGRYYSPNRTQGGFSVTGFKNYRVSIERESFLSYSTNSDTLFPSQKTQIVFTGMESKFRDQSQWREYIRSSVPVGAVFQDHQFDLTLNNLNVGEIVKNFHHPDYEDLTKETSSNLLLNWNLISYPFKSQKKDLQNVGDLLTQFDDSQYEAGVTEDINKLFDQYQARLANAIVPSEEAEQKQRNIFDLQRPEAILPNSSIQSSGRQAAQNPPLIQSTRFPYLFKKDLPSINFSLEGSDFLAKIIKSNKEKNILQSIKRDLSYQTIGFRVGGQNLGVKIYDLLALSSTTSIINFSEFPDETFLLREEEISNSSDSDRFLNQIKTMDYLAELRNFTRDNMRSYEEIIQGTGSKTFFLGYKIEKYLDNTAGSPIQTYYTKDKVFRDTQLKYGRKYIYVTKALVGVLGSTYTYSNLVASKEDGEMQSLSGEIVENNPTGFSQIQDAKFKAYVEVEVKPSLQVAEIELQTEETRFIDDIPDMPQIDFANRPHRPSVEFFFSSLYEDRPGVNDKVRQEYFRGRYEIYRLSQAPQILEQFDEVFPITVDDMATYAFSDIRGIENKDKISAHYEDMIVPNRKYYYSFKSVSYHGEKSKYSPVFEVEVLKDSDEYKLVVSEYHFPETKDFEFSKSLKRIMKIDPNIERVLFSKQESKTNWELDNGTLLQKGQNKTFKIRVTSKHTGKKMDINLRFFLDDRTNT